MNLDHELTQMPPNLALRILAGTSHSKTDIFIENVRIRTPPSDKITFFIQPEHTIITIKIPAHRYAFFTILQHSNVSREWLVERVKTFNGKETINKLNREYDEWITKINAARTMFKKYTCSPL